MTRHLGTLLLAIITACASPLASPARADDATKKLRVVLIDGQNNHDWRSTSPWLKHVLEESQRFSVDVSSNLKSGDRPGRIETTVAGGRDAERFAAGLREPIACRTDLTGAEPISHCRASETRCGQPGKRKGKGE